MKGRKWSVFAVSEFLNVLLPSLSPTFERPLNLYLRGLFVFEEGFHLQVIWLEITLEVWDHTGVYSYWYPRGMHFLRVLITVPANQA